jgi:hypothetical protein
MSKIRVLKSSNRFCHLWVESTASTIAEALETLGICALGAVVAVFPADL